MHFFWVLCLCVCNKKDCCVQTLCTQLQIICTLSKLLFQCELLLVFRKSANIILISMWTIINLLEIFQQNDYFLRTIIKVSRVVADWYSKNINKHSKCIVCVATLLNRNGIPRYYFLRKIDDSLQKLDAKSCPSPNQDWFMIGYLSSQFLNDGWPCC